MSERGIKEQDALTVADIGEVIESYQGNEPYPSELLLGWIDSSPLHVV